MSRPLRHYRPHVRMQPFTECAPITRRRIAGPLIMPNATVRGSQRLSLIRTIGAVFWVASNSGSGAYTLACEFDHACGTPKTHAALGELETWAGGGGLTVASPATASGKVTPRTASVTRLCASRRRNQSNPTNGGVTPNLRGALTALTERATPMAAERGG